MISVLNEGFFYREIYMGWPFRFREFFCFRKRMMIDYVYVELVQSKAELGLKLTRQIASLALWNSSHFSLFTFQFIVNFSLSLLRTSFGFINNPQRRMHTLIMFYKQHCKWGTSLSFSKFHSRCLAVAYFPPKSRLVSLLNFFLIYRGFSPYANFITANFITAVFQKDP